MQVDRGEILELLVDFGFALGFCGLFACYGRTVTPSSMPIWAVALVLAIFAPMAVRLYAEHLERRVRARTDAVLGQLPRRVSGATVDAAAKFATNADARVKAETSSDAAVGGRGPSETH